MDINHNLPTHIVTRRIIDRTKRVEVTVVNNLIFIRTTKQQVFDLEKKCGLKLHYLNDIETNNLPVVPDKRTDDSISLMAFSSGSLLHRGDGFSSEDKIWIFKSDLSGIGGYCQ